MAHDVFISYSSHDLPTATAVCDALEAQSVQCWIAPRDIVPGLDWSDAIIDAIVDCKVFLLVLSKSSNESEQVKREVQNAVSERKHIFTFLIEEVDLTKHMRYFIGTPHWMDALKPPIEPHLERVALSMRKLIDSMPAKAPDGGCASSTAKAAAAPAPVPLPEAASAVEALAAAVPMAEAVPVAEPITAAAPIAVPKPIPSLASVVDVAPSPAVAASPAPLPVSTPIQALPAAAPKPRRWGIAVALAMIAVIGGGVWATMGHGGKASTPPALPATHYATGASTALLPPDLPAQPTARVHRPTSQAAGKPVHAVALPPPGHMSSAPTQAVHLATGHPSTAPSTHVATQINPVSTVSSSPASTVPAPSAQPIVVGKFMPSFGSSTKLGQRGRLMPGGHRRPGMPGSRASAPSHSLPGSRASAASHSLPGHPIGSRQLALNRKRMNGAGALRKRPLRRRLGFGA